MMTTSNGIPDEGVRRLEGANGVGPAPTQEVGPGLHWVAVATEYPDDGVSVLVCREGDQDSIDIGAWHSEIGQWCNPFGDLMDEATHWMDLPEVPLEEVAP
jgi:hypothetical protein